MQNNCLSDVHSYLGHLLEQQKQVEKNKQQKTFLTQRLTDIQNLQKLLAKYRNPDMDKKYGDMPCMKCIESLKKDIKQNNLRTEQDLQKVNAVAAYAIIFGIYEYFIKIKENNKQIDLFSKLIHQTELNTADFLKAFRKIDLFLPKSVYSPDSVSKHCIVGSIFLKDYPCNLGREELSFLELARFLGVFIYLPPKYMYDTNVISQELIKLIDSLIKNFMQYCPPTAIDLYLKNTINQINKMLNFKRIKNISRKKDAINKKTLQIQSMSWQQLMNLAKNEKIRK